MEILEKIEIMQLNPLVNTISYFIMAIGFVIVWYYYLRNNPYVEPLPRIFIGFIIGMVGVLIHTYCPEEGSGHYQYKAYITDETIIKEIYNQYDNVVFESDKIVNFESDNPNIEWTVRNSEDERSELPDSQNNTKDATTPEMSSAAYNSKNDEETSSEGLTFCPECGTQTDDKWIYCGKCGEKLE